MMRRFSPFAAVLMVLVALAGCGPDATAPRQLGLGRASASNGSAPGVIGAPHIINAPGGLQGCTPRDAQSGTATIGPSGGELDVGSTRLIIPAGALTQTIQVSGTSPQGNTPTVYFEPSGLRFKKPAGLVIDASNCTDVPNVVYINELGVASAPIAAIYSNWWHTVAAPIDHFSGYAVAFDEGESANRARP
jgi:hypothetical protein